MSVLTRIKNNQITDSTIFANTKIAPGSIVGSLFNSNLTMTSDVTITGNLTVQGSSTYLTVASTNTYVNDPLIVMNNAFAGTNTNDIGLLFNRGSDTNQAFIWDESEDEFRFIATSETGETYGNVATSSFANIRVGNLTAQGAAAFGSLSTTSDIGAVNLTLSGDAAVNGGDLTSTAAIFNLINSNVTTVNFAGAATTLILGSATGTANIRNATINLIGNTTVGGTLGVTGHVTLEGVTSTGATGTGNLVFSTSPVLTTPNIGTPSFANLTNAIDLPISSLIGVAAGIADFLVIPSSSNLIAAVTDETGTGNLVFSTSPTLTTPNIGTPSFANLTNATDLPISTGVSGLAMGIADFLVIPSSSNLIAAVTDETGTGNLVFSTSPTLETSLATTSTNFDLLNTSATTVNFAGAATALTIADVSGNTAIRNNLNVGLTLQARDINNTVIGNVTPAAATFTTATVQGNTSLGLTTAAAINNTPIGNAVASTGSFTTLISSGITQVTDTTVSTGIGTGAFRVDGGASVSGNLWVGGNINIVGDTFTISGNSGQFFGDINGFGALYAGVAGFTTLPQTVFQAAADVNNYAQVNFENVNTGTDASADYVATAGNGDDINHYINMGITSPNWDGTQENSLTTALSGNDGYLYAQGDAGSGGNLVIGASTPNRTVSVIVGGNTASNVTAVYRAPGTASTNTTSGALTVIGGVGILGNVYANNLSTGGEISAADLTLTGDLAVNGGDLTTTATTFNLLDSTATTINFAGAATAIDLGATTGTLTINNPTVVGTQATQALYNTTATTLNFAGAATTLSIGADTGTVTINNDTVNLEGNVNVNKATKSTSITTGALVVDGGAGVAGNLYVGENLVIAGNLTVQGNSITLSTDDLSITDVSITVASGAVDGAAANGGGIIVDGANATLLYNHATTSWDLNKITRVTDTTDTTDENSGALRVAGGVAIAKDLFVGGGDIITDETTFNLLDATVTTLNIGGAATAIDLGATSGTLTINNPAVVGTQTTQDLYNTTATTLNFAGAATALTIGAATGTTNIRNALVDIDGNATVGGTLGVTGAVTLTDDLAVNGGDLTTTASDLNLFNSNATKVQFVQAGTEIIIGATTGSLTINNPAVVGTQSTQDLYNTTATTVNFAGAATTLIVGSTTGTANLRNATTNILGNATVGGTLGVTSDLAVNGGDITTTAATATVFNANATTVNAFGAATAIDIGATSGTLTINNPTVVGTQATQDLYNTTATTVNFAGAATTITIGAATGTTNIRNALVDIDGNATVGGTLGVTGAVTLTDDLAVNGGDLTTTATTFNLLDSTATTLNAFGDATAIDLGATTGTLTINNPTVVGTQITQDLYNTTTTTLNFAGAATALTIGAATGTTNIRNALLDIDGNVTVGGGLGVTGDTTLTGDISVNGGDLATTATTFNLLDANATTVNAFGAATSIDLGAITGTLTINNPTVVGSSTTQNLYNTTATTVNFAGSATTLNIGAASGTATVNNSTIDFEGNVNVNRPTPSTNSTSGALIVDGGMGVAGNLHIASTSQIVVGSEINSNITLSNIGAALFGNVDSAYKLEIKNISANIFAKSELRINSDISTDEIDYNVRLGIVSSTYNEPNRTIMKPNDSYLFNTQANLLLGARSGDVIVFVGGRNEEDELVRFSNNNSNVTILSNVISTSSSTGALTVRGGVGVGANLNVSGGTVINIDQTAEPFQVKGQFATTLIYADSVTDTVTIGGSNTTPISGATLRVNGTGAMVLPVGTTSQRPSLEGNVDVAGMLRLNSSLSILEYYDGNDWQSSQGAFTVIASESFSGNGVATVFTMGGPATTASSIVSINGIVQIPTTSYSITQDVLTFTEAPEVGDTIDVRRLTTTTSVDEIGFNQNLFKANIDHAYISTGTVGSIERLLIDTNGLVTVTGNMEIYGNLTVRGDTAGQINIGDSTADNVAITAEISSNLVPNANNTFDLGSPAQRWRDVYSHATVHDQTPTNVSANTTPALIDSFSTSTYSSAKYLVQIKDGSNIQAAELLLVQDNANAFITTYGVLSSNVELGGFTANISGGNVNLFYTSTTATNSNVKVHTTYIV